jgi:NAD(P) transhydrogenase subunit alpha
MYSMQEPTMQQPSIPIPTRSLRRMLFASLAFGALVAGVVGLVAPSLYARESPGGEQKVDAEATPQEERLAKDEMLLLVASVFILVLAGFLGFEVIGRVSPMLHTPLMSATNAISGISLVGSLIAAGNPKLGLTSNILGFIAVTAATINVVGGFMITDRMLKMFKLKGGRAAS